MDWVDYREMEIEEVVGTTGGTTFMVNGQPVCWSLSRKHVRAVRAMTGYVSGDWTQIKDEVVAELANIGEIVVDDSDCLDGYGWLGAKIYDPEGELIGIVGSRCSQFAGFRTDHVGTGRCYIHGGAKVGQRISTRITHGRTAIAIKAQVTTLISKYMADPEPTDLTRELAKARAILESTMAILVERGDMDEWVAKAPQLNQSIDTIGRLANRMSTIEQRYALNAGQVAYIRAVLVDTINTYIDDPIARQRAAENIMVKLGGSAPVLVADVG